MDPPLARPGPPGAPPCAAGGRDRARSASRAHAGYHRGRRGLGVRSRALDRRVPRSLVSRSVRSATCRSPARARPRSRMARRLSRFQLIDPDHLKVTRLSLLLLASTSVVPRIHTDSSRSAQQTKSRLTCTCGYGVGTVTPTDPEQLFVVSDSPLTASTHAPVVVSSRAGRRSQVHLFVTSFPNGKRCDCGRAHLRV